MLLASLLAACGGPSLLLVGETVLPPDPRLEIRVVGTDGQPVEGAQVWAGEAPVVADQQGAVWLEWRRGPLLIEVRAPGFHPTEVEVTSFPPGAALEVPLRPVLVGRVSDPDGRPMAWAVVRLAESEAVTGPDGRFRLVRAVPGELRVERPGWVPAGLSWEGGEGSIEVELEPRLVRALYATGLAAASPDTWARLMELAERTEINGMVVDLKDSSGTVYYDSRVGLARESGAARPILDLDRVVRDLEERELYAIARLVAFEDPIVAAHAQEQAVWDTVRGAPWRSDAGRAWLDPTDPVAQGYLVDLAVEACLLGFQEIQFDYVRFPTDGPVVQARFDGGYSAEVIAAFLARARKALHAEGCALAADIFGFVTRAVDEGNIGHQLEVIAAEVDVLSPMVYPSHYRSGWYGFEVPNDHPGAVVGLALDDGLARLPRATILRPWLQAFSFGPGIAYGPEEVRLQIEEAERRGLGWMLWNAGSRFSESAVRPARQ